MRFLTTAFFCLPVAALAQTSGADFLKRSQFEDIPALVLSNNKLELTVLTNGGALANLILLPSAQPEHRLMGETRENLRDTPPVGDKTLEMAPA